MPFDWMQGAQRPQKDGARRQVVQALREKAGLLKRLGYDSTYVTTRCLSELKWEFDGAQKAPMRESDVKKLVKSVFNS